MAKVAPGTDSSRELEAFEMIEMAIDDLDVLTRAFEIIENVCEELQAPNLKISENLPTHKIN